MLFQTQWRRHKTVEEINRRPSKTIPDQTMSIKEILTRYANGIPMDQGKVPIYEGEETDLPPNWDKLDLSEQQDILQENKKRIMEMQYDLQVIATLEGAGKTRTDRYMTEFDLQMKERLANNSVEMAEASLEKLRADIKFTVNQDERAEALNASNIQEAVERILKMRMERALTNEQRSLLKAQITNLGKDSELKQLDINLKKQGIQPGDEIYWRMIGQYLNKQGSTIMEDVKSIIPRSQNNYLNKKKGYRGAGGKW